MAQDIPLRGRRGAGLAALVDDGADYDLALGYSWYLEGGGSNRRNMYAAAYLRGWRSGDSSPRIIKLHQLLTGKLGIDHLNGNGLDCRRCNMREATPGQNSANMHVIPGRGVSQYKGVHQDPRTGKWAAGIAPNGKHDHLGMFASEEAAARTYDLAALAVWGEFACLNFPEGSTQALINELERVALAAHRAAVEAKRRKPLDERMRRAVRLRAEGISVPRIAAELGIARETVYKDFKRYEQFSLPLAEEF